MLELEELLKVRGNPTDRGLASRPLADLLRLIHAYLFFFVGREGERERILRPTDRRQTTDPTKIDMAEREEHMAAVSLVP